MPRQRVDNLGSVGLVSDPVETALPAAAWTSMMNVEPKDGAICSTIGEVKLFDLLIRPIYHTGYVDASQQQWLVVSDGVDVYAYTMQGVAEKITPTAGAFTNSDVGFANLNGILVVNSVNDGPFYWGGSGTVLEPLPGWDPSWTCRAMVAYRYYLVALGMTESAVDYVHKLRWSNSAAEGELPTEWIATETNDAGDDLIGETPGRIIGGVLVRDALYIVKEDAAYQLVWIGGDAILQTSRLTGASGSRLSRGFASARGNLFTFDTTDLRAFDGSRAVSIIDGRIRESLFGMLSEELWERSQLFVDETRSKLIVALVSAGYTQLSVAFIYDFDSKAWGVRRLRYGYGFDSAFVTISNDQVPWDQLGEIPGPFNGAEPGMVTGRTWDEQTDGSWNKGVYQPSRPDVIVYESNPEDTQWWVSVMALANTDSDGTPKTCMAQRIGIPIEGADGMAMVTEVWPEAEGDAVLRIRIGAQMSVGGTVMWAPVELFQCGSDASITPRITGRFICWEVESFQNASWKLGAVTFNWERAGER